MGNYGINWSNVNLDDAYEREQNLLDPYSFDTILLEIDCNLREINRETVRKQITENLTEKYRLALEIMSDNLDNIVTQAKRERNETN